MTIFNVPEQVWFLAAFGAVMALMADTAVRSWRSPERVTDPAYMWPRPAPVRSDVVIGPRLPGGSLMMPEPGLRYAVSASGHAFFESVEAHPVPRPPLTLPCVDGSFDLTWRAFTTASAALAPPVVVVPPAGAAFWSQVEGVTVEHEGASLDWSPLDEHEAATAARLPLDDVDEWLAARVREFEHELSRIGCRTVSLVRGEPQRTVDDELAAFVDGSQQLHAYRVMRIGQTGEYQMIDAARVEALQVAA